MPKERWWEKTPPKFAAPTYLVLAILWTGGLVYQMVRGKNWGVFAPFAFLFWFNAWANWYRRRKVAKSQEPEPD